jgi:hypothetical protein
MTTSIVDDLHAIAAKVAPYVALLQALEHTTGLGGPPAAIAVEVIKLGVDALSAQGKIGAVTAGQVETQLRALLARVAVGEAADDAEADAIVAARRAPK